MGKFKLHAVLGIAVLGLVMAGCAPMAVTGSAKVEKDAFGAKKRFAVVSVASLKTFAGERSLSQAFKSADEIPGANTQPLINTLSPKIISALDRDKHFVLVPEGTVLASKAYKGVAEDARKIKVLFMSEDINVAQKYKYISDPKKFGQLAKDLGVDGVIGITMTFSINSGKSGFSINGLSLGSKSYSAMASITAQAYDREGKVIWKDTSVKQAEPGDKKAIILIDTTDMTKTNFEKLHPSAIEIGGKAVEILLARFDDTMAGKETSSMQSVR